MAGRRRYREPNRLHRRTERLERLLTCLLGLLAAAAAGVALVAGQSAHATVAERARAEAADRTQVTAVLLADATPATRGGEMVARRIPVRWTDVHGVERTASVPVQGLHRAGESVPLWTADDGTVVPQPTTPGDATVAGVLVGAMTVIVAGGVVAVVGMGFYAWTGRRFRRAWEVEWERVGPEWTRRVTG